MTVPELNSPELLYLLSGDPVELAETVATMRAVEVAEALNALPPDAAARVLTSLPYDLAAQVLDEPTLENEADIFRGLDDSAAAHLIEAMSADQQADLFQELDEPERQRFFPRLAATTRAALSDLLRYPEDSAGGIMTTEFVDVPADWPVGDVLKHINEVGRVKETVYAIYVSDRQGRLAHVVSLRELMSTDRALPVVHAGALRRPISVSPLTDREEVARLISRYNLLAIPVVDEEGRVLGIVTVDDVIDAMVAEQSEDVQKFGGMAAVDEPYSQLSMLTVVRKRVGWLVALLLGEMLTVSALARFEDDLERSVVLALFVPLIMSSGGNSGSQATSLVIRAMALREVRLRDWWRVALRELPAGFLLGLTLGVLGFARVLAWQTLGWYDYGEHVTRVALTLGVTLVGVVTFGSLTGSMLPFLMQRLGFDPASASAPFVATLVDVTAILLYFGVAYLFLGGVLL